MYYSPRSVFLTIPPFDGGLANRRDGAQRLQGASGELITLKAELLEGVLI